MKKKIILRKKDIDLNSGIKFRDELIAICHMKRIIFILIFMIILGTISFLLWSSLHREIGANEVEIIDINVLSYDEKHKFVTLEIIPSSEQKYCYMTLNNNLELVINGKCKLSVPMEPVEIKFIDDYELVSDGLVVTDYVVDLKEKDKYYFPLNKEHKLAENMIVVGNPVIDWVNEDSILEINDGVLNGKKVGSTTLKAVVNDEVLEEIDVVITDTIVEMPKTFNYNKRYLPCNEYTLEESKLLDVILEYRISEAGYGTRAGAVAAARFLTLEFPYRLTYFYESGRVSNTSPYWADGEGRYYHKGLYLHKEKIKDLNGFGNGPAIWGCGLHCYEDDPPYFEPGKRYPNGLDCSGFVTWALLNGGFDVGDIGAGETPAPNQLTDKGEYTKLTRSLINSGKIKVGDLFNLWGHIGILVGEDDKNFYVAETLPTLGGVVAKKYPKSTVMNTWTHVVLMDVVYKEDGNLTDMWY